MHQIKAIAQLINLKCSGDIYLAWTISILKHFPWPRHTSICYNSSNVYFQICLHKCLTQKCANCHGGQIQSEKNELPVYKT